MKLRRPVAWLSLMVFVVVGLLNGCQKDRPKDYQNDGPNLITFSRVSEAWALADGGGTLVAVLDWQFDLKGKEAEKYVHPTSLIDGEDIGQLKPWHGEWMAEIVHTIAPGAKIMPIKARGLEDKDYERHILTGIKLAADQGAVAVCSSMGPLAYSQDLLDAIDYAEARGTIFVDVHPEYVVDEEGKRHFGPAGKTCPLILHPGPVSVPDYPDQPDPKRDICTWPYDLDAKYEDGWGYSNCPPQVAGTIALMRSANANLSNDDVRRIIVETGYMHEGFRVLDTHAAVQAALKPHPTATTETP